MPSLQVPSMATVYYKYDEASILNGLFCFDEFKKFYNGEYKPLKEHISDWYVCPELWENFRVYALKGIGKKTGNDYICLEWEPVTTNDAFLVAHELGHFIQKYNRQQLKISTRSPIWETKKLATDLGSMFDDPLVNRFLKENYNFNPAHHYTEIELRDCIDEINGIRQEPKNDIIKLLYIFFYTNQLLRWDSIKDENALQKWRKYQKLFRSKLKSIAKSGEELYSMVIEDGYDTLEKQKLLFNKIVNKYTIDGTKLSDILYID